MKLLEKIKQRKIFSTHLQKKTFSDHIMLNNRMNHTVSTYYTISYKFQSS